MEMRTLVVECEVAADKSATTPVRLRVISAQRKMTPKIARARKAIQKPSRSGKVKIWLLAIVMV